MLILNCIFTDNRALRLDDYFFDTENTHFIINHETRMNTCLKDVVKNATETADEFIPNVMVIMAGVFDLAIYNESSAELSCNFSSTSNIENLFIESVRECIDMLYQKFPEAEIVVCPLIGCSFQIWNKAKIPHFSQLHFNDLIVNINKRIRVIHLERNGRYLDTAKSVHKTCKRMWTAHYSYLTNGLNFNDRLCNNMYKEMLKYLARENIKHD